MTLDDFIKKYQGKFVEYHSYNANALYQCTDLANQYITEVLGLPAIIGTNAQDFPSKRGDNYDWIVNTPKGLPEKGDLMIFKSADGVGHISIFIEGNLSLFKSFDQNYPTGSPCQIVQHNYRNVLGWLHPKKGIMPVMYKGLDLTNQDSMKVAVDIWDEVVNQKLYYKKDEVHSRYNVASLDQLDSVIAGLKSRITTLENELGKYKAEVTNREEQVSRLNDKLIAAQNEINSLRINLNNKITEYDELAVAKGKQYIELQQALTTIETLKQQVQQGEVTLSIRDLIKLILNQKITIKKG